MSYDPEDFGGSDYMDPEEEKRYIEQQRKHIGESKQLSSVTMTTDAYNDLEQRVKNGEGRAEFLQQLVDSSEAANIERQGKIEALEKEQEALLVTVAQLRSENKKLTNRVNIFEHQKTTSREVIDYTRADPDLLTDFALAVLDNGVDYDGFTGEARDLQEQIEKSATFHPHVQQEVVYVDNVLRFRQNKLVNQIVEEAGNGKGLNYIATLEASVEDRAQLAQLIGYSVSGYGDLSYSLPLEEDKIPKQSK